MSFDRRWLFRATSAAFFASLFRSEEGSGAAPVKGPAPTGAKTPEEFFGLYELGFGRKLTAAEEAVARKALWAGYKDRFDKRMDSISDVQKAHLEGFATMLGTLTARNLENDQKGTCGWGPKAKPEAKLGPEHVEAARDLLGFYFNRKIKRCVPEEYKILQADEPCPLCPMP